MFANPSFGGGSSYLAVYSTQLAHLVRQRHAEASLRDTQARAEVLASSLRRVLEQTRAESDLLVTMSHELRTLLNAIVGFSGLMSREAQGPLPERYREYAADIEASGRDLLKLVEAVHENTPILPPDRGLEEKPLALGEVVRGAYQDVRELARDKGVKVQARLARDLPSLRADEGCVKQMLVDLIAEAVRRSPAETPVDLVIKRAERGGLIVQVQNAEPPDTPVDIALGAEGDQARLNFFAEIHQATVEIAAAGDGCRAATVAFPAERLVTASGGLDAAPADGHGPH